MHVLSELASAGVISVVFHQAVRLVHFFLDYRIESKKIEIKRQKIELRRQRLGLTPGSQSTQVATAKHATRRRKRK